MKKLYFGGKWEPIGCFVKDNGFGSMTFGLASVEKIQDRMPLLSSTVSQVYPLPWAPLAFPHIYIVHIFSIQIFVALERNL